MKRKVAFLLFVLLWGYGFSQGFTVDNFVADIYLDTDGSFRVEEHYDITFSAYKHGIFRNIQLKYDMTNEAGSFEKRRIKISRIEVPGHHFETSGKLRRQVEGEVEIKIGDKNKTIIGPQQYDIYYTVKNAFLYESKATYFYWNIKPPQWQAPFQKVTFRIHVPEDIAISTEDLQVYAGALGATDGSQFNITFQNGVYTVQSKEGFYSYYGQSVTALLALPNGSIAEYKPWWPFGAYYGWTLIIGLLIIGFYFLWRKHGKEDKVISATSYYPPQGIDPALAGYLIDDSADTYDLISLIPYWGAKGLITIEEIPKKGWLTKADIKLKRIKDLPGDAPHYERLMFNGLLRSGEVTISSLKDTFYTTMNSAKSSLKTAAQPYYIAKSRKVMIQTALVLVLLLLALPFLVLTLWGVWPMVFVILTCVVLLILNRYMTKKNPKGNTVYAQLLGFQKFVKLSEAKKLKTLLAEDPRYFEDTMAYAMAFGLFNQWAKKFDTLNIPPPTWYNSHSNNAFTMHHFSNSFSSAMSTARSTMVSSPSSSGSGGGGSSGGGFGGGGGGSW
ncbi:MAG: DUF2207 domain-containing protein [Flavobacteriaceae bacterium]